MTLEILRRKPGGEAAWQSYPYKPSEPGETVATALTRLNESLEDPIRWDCGCLQKKCGACAMVINGRPRLACEARLETLGSLSRIEPLRKFPVVEDLVVDRSVLFENLKTVRAWLDSNVPPGEHSNEDAFEACRCLQCGCCLEVCPNFCPEGNFTGMAAAMPLTRLLSQLPPEKQAELAAQYRAQVYEGCGKSLACRNVCPAKLDIDRLLARSNAAAVWKKGSWKWKRRKSA